VFGPTRQTRKELRQLERRIHKFLGKPTILEKFLGAGAILAAAVTAVTLKLNLFQHPKLIRSEYRLDSETPPPSAVPHRTLPSSGNDAQGPAATRTADAQPVASAASSS